MKIRWRLLPDTLPENGFVRNLNCIVKFLTSMTLNFNHHQRLSVLVAFSYFSVFCLFFFLILEFNTMCLFGLALFSEIFMISAKEK